MTQAQRKEYNSKKASLKKIYQINQLLIIKLENENQVIMKKVFRIVDEFNETE